MTVFTVRHATRYSYARPVAFGEHQILFRPRDSYDQRLLSSDLVVTPAPAEPARWLHDVFGNCVAFVKPGGPAAELVFESTIRVEHAPQSAPAFRTATEALRYPFPYSPEEVIDLGRTTRRHYPDTDGEVARWAGQFVRKGGKTDTGALLMTLCYAIRESFAYARRFERGTQAPAMTLATRRGTCRDFALFMMEAVRALGLAARFVTGYIYVPDRDGPERLGGGATHAWCQVYLPGAGWVEFDPTNGIVGNRDLIRVAVARDPSQAVPLSGSYSGAAADALGMSVEVQVTSEAATAPPAAAGTPLASKTGEAPAAVAPKARSGAGVRAPSPT